MKEAQSIQMALLLMDWSMRVMGDRMTIEVVQFFVHLILYFLLKKCLQGLNLQKLIYFGLKIQKW